MIEILTDEEVETLVTHINPNSVLGARLNVIVSILMDTGIRATELLTLKISHIEMDSGRMKVLGKGSKERFVPFGLTAKKAILRYMELFRPVPRDETDDTLILSLEGEPLTYDGLSHIIKRLGVSAGIPRLRAHLFRHSFAVKYLMNGGDVMTLRLILGHTDLSVTQVYMHLAQSHVQIQHSKFSPLDRLNIKRRRG